ncbi:MAG: glutamate-5-semialdehyde dehydrogenase [Candidatus Aureabacteria bacterium]|nr:glutamate-5-semialdehyde dehydrogenase [Candidatus Auribacterota bacterium]
MTINIKDYVLEMARKAKDASYSLVAMSADNKNKILKEMAKALRNKKDFILKANKEDLKEGENSNLSEAMLERLLLDNKRVEQMAKGLEDVAALDDPVGRVLDKRTRPNGLEISKISVPIGVIAIIFESRPNVTSDAAALCIKSGNAVILRGGKEAIGSNMAIAQVMNEAASRIKAPDGMLQLVETTDREAVNELLKLNSYIDLVIPRGGEGLIKAVVENATIPVIKHYKGICHIYVDKDADIDKALDIVINAKCQRPGVCNAAETLLIDEQIARTHLPLIAARLRKSGVELRGCEKTARIIKDVVRADEQDWKTEYLDLILSIKIVGGVAEAIKHINDYGSMHSDAIITENKVTASKFLNMVDASSVYFNASTRFTDGGEFGMGAEIGISTDKIHARGPMGLEELNIYKYVIKGDGQIRE